MVKKGQRPHRGRRGEPTAPSAERPASRAGPMWDTPRVFLSHSHKDRHEALRVHRLLGANHAVTFLDQEEIEVGDDLPARIQEGIESCDVFLVLWSTHAQASKWVRLEMKTACNRSKRVVPYRLDDEPLPTVLEDLVFIEPSDRQHGDGALLRAIFGRVPDEVYGVDFLPGNWAMELSSPAMAGVVTYEVELRVNGQVEGNCRFDVTDPLTLWAFEEARRMEVDVGFLARATRLCGSWAPIMREPGCNSRWSRSGWEGGGRSRSSS